MIKLKLQNSSNKEPMDRILAIIKKRGIQGMYRGVWATGAGYLPTWAIYYTVYDNAKQRHGTTTSGLVISSLLAGTVCTIATNPIWIVRSTTCLIQPG
jgi:solute carrier family 25 (mitochondrial folate transporter), member 32